MKRFFKLTLIIGITMIALAISNIAYADDDFDILTPTDLPTESTSTTAPTTTTTTPSTSTTLEIPKTTTTTVKITKTTNTSLPHTGIEDKQPIALYNIEGIFILQNCKINANYFYTTKLKFIL